MSSRTRILLGPFGGLRFYDRRRTLFFGRLCKHVPTPVHLLISFKRKTGICISEKLDWWSDLTHEFIEPGYGGCHCTVYMVESNKRQRTTFRHYIGQDYVRRAFIDIWHMNLQDREISIIPRFVHSASPAGSGSLLGRSRREDDCCRW